METRFIAMDPRRDITDWRENNQQTKVTEYRGGTMCTFRLTFTPVTDIR